MMGAVFYMRRIREALGEDNSSLEVTRVTSPSDINTEEVTAMHIELEVTTSAEIVEVSYTNN